MFKSLFLIVAQEKFFVSVYLICVFTGDIFVP